MVEVVYKLVCPVCGHTQIDNIRWVNCLIRGCQGRYKIVDRNPAGI